MPTPTRHQALDFEPPFTLVMRDARGVEFGEIHLDDFRSRFWEAFVVSKHALDGVDRAVQRVQQIFDTARDPSAPDDVRRGNACGVLLVDLAMRAVAHSRGYVPAPPPPPAPDPIEVDSEVGL